MIETKSAKSKTQIWDRFFKLSDVIQSLLIVLTCALFVMIYGFMIYGREFNLGELLKNGVFDFYTILVFLFIFTLSFSVFRSYAVLCGLSVVALVVKILVLSHACKLVSLPIYSYGKIVCNEGSFTLLGWFGVTINELSILAIISAFLYFKKRVIGEKNV